MKVRISSENLSGKVRIPGSKSYSQRYILLSGMADSPVSIRGLSYSEDEQVALSIIEKAGSKITYNGDTVRIEPDFKCPESVDVGESATSYRLAIGMLAAGKCKTEFTGKPQLAGRPVEDLIESLEAIGARFQKKPDGFMILDATRISPGNLEIDQTRSSQYVSALLLFMALSGSERSTLRVRGKKASEGYVRITEECMGTMGFQVERKEDTYTVSRGEGMPEGNIRIEGDYSSAAFFLVLGLLASNDGIVVEGLRKNSLQSDSAILEILDGTSNGLTFSTKDGVVDVRSRKAPVKHVEIDADRTPDLAPPISVIGIFSDEGVTIRNPSRLSIKETDRMGEIIRLSEAFGAVTERGNDYLTVRKGSKILNPGVLEFDDHRMVMSAIVAGIASGYDVEYNNIERINKSYPSFLRDLKKIGAVINMLPVP